MQDPTESLNYLERALQFVLLPASLYGAGGALMHSARKGRSIPQALLEVVGGVVTANMVCPLIQAETPEKWHYTLFFLVGWGGLELVGRIYEAAVCALERYIQRKINPDEIK
ncbi:hypothetical protein [uncultured Desulfovibrio sp.]|uniref:hypothetical protein n=1 Tax=uncultured Desulfovibrio sp. TaxID=167968 RepID=UPI00205E4DF6|nr:hypothetical protein [uncultured Desulfovibrio sp.]DAT79984.1 MAG TPA: hypothetical protein [Caudoviricetes sp.]